MPRFITTYSFRSFAFPQDRPLTIDALLERFLTGTEKEKTWNIKYRERDGVKTRVVMWDMTGIEAYRFGAAKLQRNTYSKYYGGNYFKGGIAIQLCSWGLTWPLWAGHESDSGYHESADYLEAQEEFQQRDLVRSSTSENTLEVVPFTNVLDNSCWHHVS